MKIGKQARRDAKDLFLACKREGVLDEARVRQTALEYAFLMHTMQGKSAVASPLDAPRL